MTVTGVYDDGPLKGYTVPELPDPPPKTYFGEELVAEDNLIYPQDSPAAGDVTPEDHWEKHPYRLVAIDRIQGPVDIKQVAHYSYAPDLTSQ